MVRIKGIIPASFIDYPNHISMVLFLAGCNMKCPYCHNPELIRQEPPYISEEQTIKQIRNNLSWLDGVCITGGEPLIQDITGLLKKIRKTGLEIKIDTNGTNPERLKQLIKQGLVDYVALDVKTSPEKYNLLNGSFEKVEKSIRILQKSNITYEFRITTAPGIITSDDIKKISKILKGARLVVLQGFNNEKNLDPEYSKKEPFTQKEIQEFKKILEKKTRRVIIR